jgi:uncharacterized C2H2 Zn-finger protein
LHSALPNDNSGPRQARTSAKKPKKSALKKIYQCPHCTYVSDRADNVKSHVKTVNEEPDKGIFLQDCLYKNNGVRLSFTNLFWVIAGRCHHPECPRVYKRKADLTKHLRQDHGDDSPKDKRTLHPKKIPEDGICILSIQLPCVWKSMFHYFTIWFILRDKNPCQFAPECTNRYVNLNSRPCQDHLKNCHGVAQIPPPELVEREMVRKAPWIRLFPYRDQIYQMRRRGVIEGYTTHWREG